MLCLDQSMKEAHPCVKQVKEEKQLFPYFQLVRKELSELTGYPIPRVVSGRSLVNMSDFSRA